MAMNNSEVGMSLLPFLVVPSFSAMLYSFNINNMQFFVVAAANIELQWYFAFGCNCRG
jgi:ABC-type spermidine/putrescine transport system permease subunit II